ncbi:hypothetical protein CEUSTIGMA_g3650.t1 [Chlamydomonas eustigma]|uniref:RING-type domain-containing protein n=1 Tax=Chlamydomonas eustigma TaxID=1157962 RepID=A0A250WZJ9_9CHLO|nr:hypothetical protein CEUSTIGMA_g3650.t1 [Chlamydomonas eustigma]|eukprot:GAX76206.1 hypothetical protein CEUSTIGMA_g3650.t1 [Chlamydomonas eustigma]
MGDDGEWQVVQKKSSGRKENNQPSKEKLAEIRAQVAALRAGTSIAAPKISPASTKRAVVTPALAPVRAPVQNLCQIQQQPVLRRLTPPEGTESVQTRLNGEKYYQAFVRVTKDVNGNVTVRFHKTDVATVKASGTVILTTGGWFTTTTMYTMNDILKEIDIQIRAEGSPNDGRWTVVHPGGSLSYHDDISIEGSSSAHRHRANIVLRASLEQGIACFAYVLPGGHDSSAADSSSVASTAQTLVNHSLTNISSSLTATSTTASSSYSSDAGRSSSLSSAQTLLRKQQRLPPPHTLAAEGKGCSAGTVHVHLSVPLIAPANCVQDDRVGLGTLSGGPLLFKGELSLAPLTPPLMPSTTAPALHSNLSAINTSSSASRMFEPPTALEAAEEGANPKLTAEHFDTYLMDDILDEDTACIACMARTREVIIIPCGHLVLCGQCSKGINTCPMCRVEICELISLG